MYLHLVLNILVRHIKLWNRKTIEYYYDFEKSNEQYTNPFYLLS